MAKEIYYHFHLIPVDHTVRVWRSDHPGDVFEVFPAESFPELVLDRLALMFPTSFVLGFPEDDDGTITCNQCLKEKHIIAHGR